MSTSRQGDHPPLLIDAATVSDWSATADVVIMGFGMAGACAALEARAAGASVVIVERTSGCTGSTSAAAGHFYLGGGTPVQQACGFDDDPVEMARYLEAVALDPDREKIRLYSEGSVAHFDWLEAQGVPFDRSYYPQKNVVQPGRECLIWTGNEQVWPYRDMAKPAPRGHKVAFEGEEGGGALALRILSERAEAAGATVMADCKVEGLIREGDRIVGVQARRFGEPVHVRARHGVVLAGGGFGQNPDMVARHVPILASAYVQGSPHDDGLAIRLGAAAGGTPIHMDEAFLTSPFYPPENLLKGILVNRDGQRFVAEDSYHSRSGIFSARQPDGIVYLIVDAAIFGYPHFASLTNQRLIDGFATVAEMEAGLALPEGSLQATMAEYNRHAADGADPDFHKHPKWLKPLDEAPYAAFDLSFGRAVYTGFTLGGLRVSADGEVLDAAGTPLPGLYAAGACASNIAQDSNGYASGTCLGEASFFGRRAGAHAARLPARKATA
ncbi:FAD-binding protein [Edaphosphingomonas haloaromaticamans]|uniref:Urocanate reductase n=1 Tax=Edaphosphingomonas haloaromaticamans TaxID=653954 RepID=A0A1S1HEI1_9SPHN|nr:FAD-binding protein [Sphingomonas haloaromaticamans]OHT20659.1 Urocanate reductase precursor [Sphingomonas haloaromaticamans]